MNENEVVSQWLDPDEVRSLAEGLLAKTPVSQIPSHESVFGENFEGFDGEPSSSAPPLQSIASEPSNPFSQTAPKPKSHRPAIEELKQPARPDSFYEQQSPVAPTASAQKTARPSGLSSLPRALGAFSDWLKKQTPILAAFVCDPKGQIMLDEVGSEKLIKVARSLVHALITKGVGEPGELLQVVIAEDRMIEILPLKSNEGHSIAGLVVARPLTPEALTLIHRSFKTVLSRSLTPGE
ncbi:MAG: hypothetical protein ABGZ08_14730 [Akkermansiaceae bacterium]